MKTANENDLLQLGTSTPVTGAAVGGLMKSGNVSGGSPVGGALESGFSSRGSPVGGALESGFSATTRLVNVGLQAGITAPKPHVHPFFAHAAMSRPAMRAGRMGVYTPNNKPLFNSALSGFIAGVYLTVPISDTNPADYAGIVNQAEVFAESMDEQLAPTTISEAQEQLIFGMSKSESAYRWTTNTPLSDYTGVTAAILALLFAAGSAIQPVTPPGGGPWTQTLEVISANDTNAGVEAAGGSAIGLQDVAFGGTADSGTHGNAFAGSGGVANGGNSTAFCQGTANRYNDFAVGVSSVATSVTSGTGSAAAFGGGVVIGDQSFGSGGSAVTGTASAGFNGSTVDGDGSFAACQGIVNGNDGFAATGGNSSGGNVAFNTGTASTSYAFAAGPFAVAQGQYSTAFAGGEAVGTRDFAAGFNSFASSPGAGSAVAFSGGGALNDGAFAVTTATAHGVNSAAFGSAIASGLFDFASGPGSVATSVSAGGAFAVGGGSALNDGAVSLGVNTVSSIGGCKIGIDGGSLFSANADGDGTTEIDCGANNVFAIGNVATQFTVGAAGAASALPANPSFYMQVSFPSMPGTFVCPFYAAT
jgi:hypothetical protein